MADGTVDIEKLMGLLGLARRAGKLAVGFSAVEKMVRHGQRPLVILASDAGASQKNKVLGWKRDDPKGPRDVWTDVMDSERMARALGREKLVVLGVSEPGFVRGILKLRAG